MAFSFIGIGGNLDTPLLQVRKAVDRLANTPEITVLKASSCYGSKPQGPQDQPDYVNAVVLIETLLSPHQLLSLLQQLETELGKVKVRHWGERVIDLDIITYDNLQLSTADLQLPHPQMHLRDFVLLPLQEIAPEFCLNDVSIQTLIERLDNRFVVPLIDKQDSAND